MNGKEIYYILHEYGILWAINRGLYSAKLKMLNLLPMTEVFFEKKTAYPERINLFEPATDCLKQFIRSLPEKDRLKLIKRADEACVGKIQGFSSIELDYGYPVQWQLNPITGRKCDERKKWYQIPDFDMERGDIKVVWEISRFSHFVTFSRAFLLTEDSGYYKAFSEQLEDWLRKNPYSYGASFKCGQECALRMVNVLLAYSIFTACGLTTERDVRNVKELILRCYRKIRSNFFYAYHCIKNNHTISELLGMLMGAWCCGDDEQLGKAFQLLNKVIEEQFTEDGGYIQHSFNYERLALQDIEVVLAVEKNTGFALNKRSKRILLHAAKMMYQCQDECGDMPNYGSNDGALVFPVTSCTYRDFRPVINTIHALLTGERLYAKGVYDEELIWFSGKAAGAFKQKYEEKTSHFFEQAGLCTIRNGNSWIMIVLNDYHSRPSHMDQLHIDLWVQGINVLCDSGTFSYADELGRRLVLNESHNTLVYENRPQMSTSGPFLIYDWTKRSKIDANSGFFCGVMYSKKNYSHKRKIKTTDKGFQICDQIKGKDGEMFEIRFHTPCEIRREKNFVKLLHKGKLLCILKFQKPFYIFEAFRSLFYLKEDKIWCIAVAGVVQDGKGSVNTEILMKGL